MNMGAAELIWGLFAMVFALAPLVVMIIVIVAVFRRLDRIVTATEATAEGVRRLEQRSGPGI